MPETVSTLQLTAGRHTPVHLGIMYAPQAHLLTLAPLPSPSSLVLFQLRASAHTLGRQDRACHSTCTTSTTRLARCNLLLLLSLTAPCWPALAGCQALVGAAAAAAPPSAALKLRVRCSMR